MRILYLSALLVWNLDRLLLAMFVWNLVIVCSRALAGVQHHDCEGCLDFCVLVRRRLRSQLDDPCHCLGLCVDHLYLLATLAGSLLCNLFGIITSAIRLKLFLPPYYDNLSSLLVMLRKKPVCSPALVLGGTLEFRNHGRSVWLPRKQFLNLNGENNI